MGLLSKCAVDFKWDWMCGVAVGQRVGCIPCTLRRATQVPRPPTFCRCTDRCRSIGKDQWQDKGQGLMACVEVPHAAGPPGAHAAPVSTMAISFVSSKDCRRIEACFWNVTPPPQEVYSAPDMAGLFDCVATCFFLDTAHNVLQYLAVISRALAPGGHWVHLGPLLYHWADAHTYLEVGQAWMNWGGQTASRVVHSDSAVQLIVSGHTGESQGRRSDGLASALGKGPRGGCAVAGVGVCTTERTADRWRPAPYRRSCRSVLPLHPTGS